MAADETVRMLLEGRGEHFLPMLLGSIGEAEVQSGRGEQTDAGMAMFVVVPGEEPLAEGPRILDGSETIRKFRAVLHGAELAF